MSLRHTPCLLLCPENILNGEQILIPSSKVLFSSTSVFRVSLCTFGGGGGGSSVPILNVENIEV